MCSSLLCKNVYHKLVPGLATLHLSRNHVYFPKREGKDDWHLELHTSNRTEPNENNYKFYKNRL